MFPAWKKIHFSLPFLNFSDIFYFNRPFKKWMMVTLLTVHILATTTPFFFFFGSHNLLLSHCLIWLCFLFWSNFRNAMPTNALPVPSKDSPKFVFPFLWTSIWRLRNSFLLQVFHLWTILRISLTNYVCQGFMSRVGKDKDSLIFLT